MWIEVNGKPRWQPSQAFRDATLSYFAEDPRMKKEDRDLVANAENGCANTTIRYAEMVVRDEHANPNFQQTCRNLLLEYFRRYDMGDPIKVHFIEQNGPCIARYHVNGYGVLKSKIPANKKASDHLPRIRRRFVEERGWVPPRYKDKPFLRDLKREQLRNRARRERENAR